MCNTVWPTSPYLSRVSNKVSNLAVSSGSGVAGVPYGRLRNFLRLCNIESRGERPLIAPSGIDSPRNLQMGAATDHADAPHNGDSIPVLIDQRRPGPIKVASETSGRAPTWLMISAAAMAPMRAHSASGRLRV